MGSDRNQGEDIAGKEWKSGRSDGANETENQMPTMYFGYHPLYLHYHYADSVRLSIMSVICQQPPLTSRRCTSDRHATKGPLPCTCNRLEAWYIITYPVRHLGPHVLQGLFLI